MHDHQLDLIAQLAEGSLTGEEAATAQSLVDSDPAAAAEYRAQLSALDAIRKAGPAMMTDAERARLRGSLNEQLGIERPEPERARPRRRFAWNGIAVAAAALVGVVLLGPVLGILSTGNDASTTDTQDFARLSAEPPAAATEATDGAPEAGEDATGSQQQLLSDDGPAATIAAAPTTVAPATTTPYFRFGADDYVYLGDIDERVLGQISEDAARYYGDPEGLADALDRYAGATPAAAELRDRINAIGGCSEDVPVTADGPIAVAELSGSTVILYTLETTGTGSPVLLVLDLDSCEPIEAAGGG